MKKYMKGIMWLIISYVGWYIGLLWIEYKRLPEQPVGPYHAFVEFGIDTDSMMYVPFPEGRGDDDLK